MTGDNVTVVAVDAAGAEWVDALINIQTSARQMDDLAYPATSGRSLLVAASGSVPATSLETQAKADVNAEVVDCLTVDTYAEPAVVPAATASLKDKIGYQQLIARNRIEQTSLQQVVKAANRRFSMISLGMWRGRIVSTPDGGIDTADERFQWALMYPPLTGPTPVDCDPWASLPTVIPPAHDVP